MSVYFQNRRNGFDMSRSPHSSSDTVTGHGDEAHKHGHDHEHGSHHAEHEERGHDEHAGHFHDFQDTPEWWDKAYSSPDGHFDAIQLTPLLPQIYDTLTDKRSCIDILVPLCGKSPDLLWLAEKGHRVAGAEWSEVAVKQFFEERKLEYTFETCNIGGKDIPVYTGKVIPITIYCGDFFAFGKGSHKLAGRFDCIWDCGSVCSIRKEARSDYAAIDSSLLKPKGKLFLSVYEWDTPEPVTEPCFPLPIEDIRAMFQDQFEIKLLLEADKKTVEEFFQMMGGDDETNTQWKIYELTKKD